MEKSKRKKSNKIRIFVPVPPPDKIMVNIKRQKDKTLHLILVGGTLETCHDYVKEAIEPHASTFLEGQKTQVELREYFGQTNSKVKNGRSMSFTFYGKSPGEVLDILHESFESEKEVLEQPRVKKTTNGSSVAFEPALSVDDIVYRKIFDIEEEESPI